MKKSVIYLLVALLGLLIAIRLIFNKHPVPEVDRGGMLCRKVAVGRGPEDLVIDRWHNPPRVLVSCYDRRREPDSGEIYFFDTYREHAYPMPRVGEPDWLKAFRPHGMDIRQASGKTLLYVILHDPRKQGKRSANAVGVYRVSGGTLELVEIMEDSRLWSPNNLSVLANGEIYLTNDARTRLDQVLMRHRSEVVHYHPGERRWRTVARGIGYANGIVARDDRVFVVASLGNRVIEFPRNADGTLGEGETLVELKGGDNLTWNDNYLLAAAHYDFMAFLRHSWDRTKSSPAVIVRINPYRRIREPVFADPGDMINAATTARIFNHRLYIAQAFDPFVLVCDLAAGWRKPS